MAKHEVRIKHVGGAAIELFCADCPWEHRLGIEPKMRDAIQAMWDHTEEADADR